MGERTFRIDVLEQGFILSEDAPLHGMIGRRWAFSTDAEVAAKLLERLRGDEKSPGTTSPRSKLPAEEDVVLSAYQL